MGQKTKDMSGENEKDVFRVGCGGCLGLPRDAYDLDADEWCDALAEAAEFAKTIAPWPIPKGHGTYKEKRRGLGVIIHAYHVTVNADGTDAWKVEYYVCAWRTGGETRFPRFIPNTWRFVLRDRLPTVHEAAESVDRPLAESYWWFDGLNFNRPVMCAVRISCHVKHGASVRVYFEEETPTSGFDAAHFAGRSFRMWGPVKLPAELSLKTGSHEPRAEK